MQARAYTGFFLWFGMYRGLKRFPAEREVFPETGVDPEGRNRAGFFAELYRPRLFSCPPRRRRQCPGLLCPRQTAPLPVLPLLPGRQREKARVPVSRLLLRRK